MNHIFSFNREQNVNEIKKKPPSPPKRHSESITVVADLHCTHIPPDPAPSTPPWSAEERQLIASLKAQGGSDSSFKVPSCVHILIVEQKIVKIVINIVFLYFYLFFYFFCFISQVVLVQNQILYLSLTITPVPLNKG